MLASGLQFDEFPRHASRILQFDAQRAAHFNEVVSELGKAIITTDEWNDYVEAYGRIDKDVRAELISARAEIQRRLMPADVDKHEPYHALRRSEFRSSIVSEVVSNLSGVASAYARSFDSVDSLIELAAMPVLGTLVVNARIPELKDVQQLRISRSGRDTLIDFDQLGGIAMLVELGDLLYIDDPLVPDVIKVTGTEFNLSAAEGRVFT